MTTIAWDGESVAADTLAIAGGYHLPRPFIKIKRSGDIVYAFYGFYSYFEPMIAWYESGCDPDKPPKHREDAGHSALFVFKDGKCHMFRLDTPYPDVQHAPNAWGVGAEYAIGAMKNGADARRAVETAIECTVETGGDVIVEELG